MNGSKKEDDTTGKPRAVGWETVHIFISSTFNDMHAERDYLIKEVFPELRDWCEERKLRLVDIDLRWGVTETDATRNKNVVQVCLDRIDKARPFFVCFLGQRYGWVPTDDEIAPETFRNFAGLGNAVEQSASVTEMEVLHALLRDPFDRSAGTRLPAEHAFFYLRDPGYLAQVPSDLPPLRRTYTDEAELDATSRAFLLGKQAGLRRTVIEDTNRPARPYSGQWNPAARTPELALPLLCPSSDKKNRERWRKQWKDWAGVATTDEAVVAADEAKARAFNDRLCTGRLEDFQSQDRTLGAVILDDLKGAILARCPERKELPEQDELEQEIDRHDDFVRTATDVFLERTGDFAELDAYAAGSSRKLFVLVAKAGLGKSTLLANWVARWRAREGKPGDETIHARFVGVGERSSTVDSLLRSILEELRRAEKLANEISDNTNLLRSKFAELLGECGKKGRTVVVIDALNQLQSGLTDLDWLARDLPENVKLVVSFKLGEKQGDALAAQTRVDGRVTVSEVQPFRNLHHRRDLVAAYLKQYLKELDEQHLEALIRADGTENPLFLKVVLTELRVFGAFARLGDMIKHEFGATPQSAFDAVLRRLENDPSYTAVPSRQAVPLLFGSLAHSRGGLPEDLLVRMFLDELGFGEDRSDNMRATIRLLLRQVRPFLARREGRTDFFYEAFQLAAKARYTESEAEAMLLPAGSGASVASSVSPSGRPRSFLHKLLARVRGGGWPNAKRVLGPPAGTSIGPSTLAPPRWPRPQWHMRLARACERWAEIKRAAKRYALGNLVHHEVEAGNGAAAAGAMTDFAYHYERFMSLGRDDVENIAADFTLTDTAAGLAPAARDRLAIWRAFCAKNSHLLRRPNALPQTSLLQLAVAHAETSPVTASAERWLELAGSDVCWMRSLRRSHEVEYGACLRTLEGHTDWVNAIALSSDGRRVVSGSRDKTIKLWNLDTGECLRTLLGHMDSVCAVAFSADSRRALSGSQDKTLRLWDLDTGLCLRTLKGHRGSVIAVAVLPDGRRALSGSDDKKLKLWSLKSGRCLRTLDQQPPVAVLPDGRRALSGGADNTLNLWDLDNGQCLQTLEGHTSRLNAVAVSFDGRRALSAGADNTLNLWDLDNGQCLQTLHEHWDQVWAVALSSDGHRALSGSFDATLRFWDLDTGQHSRLLRGHQGQVLAVALCSDGCHAVSGSADTTLKLWDLSRGQASGEGVKTLEGNPGFVKAVAVLPDGRRAASWSANNVEGTIIIWSLETGRCLSGFKRQMQPHSNVAFSSDGRLALSGSDDKKVNLWNLETGGCLCTLEGHTGWGQAVALSSDSRRALLGSWDHALDLWDLNTRQRLQTLRGHTAGARAAALSSDGRRALSGGDDNTLKLWDLDSGQCLRTLLGHTAGVRAAALSSDGRRALSGSDDNTLRLWDIETGRSLHTLRGHTAGVQTVAFLPDGRRALSGAGGFAARSDCTLKLWDLETGFCLATWLAGGAVYCCAASPEFIVAGTGGWTVGEGGDVLFLKLMPPGRITPETTAAAWHPSRPLIAVARANGTILVQEWHPASQYLEELARCPGSPVERLQWSRDGAHIFAVASDGTERILDANTLREASGPTSSWSEPRDTSPDGLWRAVIRDGRLEIVPTAPAPNRAQ